MREKILSDSASADRPLSARALQIVGIALVVALIVFWMVTGKQSALMIFVAAGMALLGRFDQVFGSLLRVFGRAP